MRQAGMKVDTWGYEIISSKQERDIETHEKESHVRESHVRERGQREREKQTLA